MNEEVLPRAGVGRRFNQKMAARNSPGMDMFGGSMRSDGGAGCTSDNKQES